MQTPIRLHIGVHLESPSTLAMIQKWLERAGHRVCIDPPGNHSLGDYLEIIWSSAQQTACAPYDLLILGGAEADHPASPTVLLPLAHLLVRVDLPVLLLTSIASGARYPWRDLPNFEYLPAAPLPKPLFFWVVARLTKSPLEGLREHMRGRQDPLREEEWRRLKVRQTWLDQREAWLEERERWLDQREGWLQRRERDTNPQQEWIAEQRAWLEQQRKEVRNQWLQVCDQRRWLNRSQARLEEQPPDLNWLAE